MESKCLKCGGKVFLIFVLFSSSVFSAENNVNNEIRSSGFRDGRFISTFIDLMDSFIPNFKSVKSSEKIGNTKPNNFRNFLKIDTIKDNVEEVDEQKFEEYVQYKDEEEDKRETGYYDNDLKNDSEDISEDEEVLLTNESDPKPTTELYVAKPETESLINFVELVDSEISYNNDTQTNDEITDDYDETESSEQEQEEPEEDFEKAKIIPVSSQSYQKVNTENAQVSNERLMTLEDSDIRAEKLTTPQDWGKERRKTYSSKNRHRLLSRFKERNRQNKFPRHEENDPMNNIESTTEKVMNYRTRTNMLLNRFQNRRHSIKKDIAAKQVGVTVDKKEKSTPKKYGVQPRKKYRSSSYYANKRKETPTKPNKIPPKEVKENSPQFSNNKSKFESAKIRNRKMNIKNEKVSPIQTTPTSNEEDNSESKYLNNNNKRIRRFRPLKIQRIETIKPKEIVEMVPFLHTKEKDNSLMKNDETVPNAIETIKFNNTKNIKMEVENIQPTKQKEQKKKIRFRPKIKFPKKKTMTITTKEDIPIITTLPPIIQTTQKPFIMSKIPVLKNTTTNLPLKTSTTPTINAWNEDYIVTTTTPLFTRTPIYTNAVTNPMYRTWSPGQVQEFLKEQLNLNEQPSNIWTNINSSWDLSTEKNIEIAHEDYFDIMKTKSPKEQNDDNKIHSENKFDDIHNQEEKINTQNHNIENVDTDIISNPEINNLKDQKQTWKTADNFYDDLITENMQETTTQIEQLSVEDLHQNNTDMIYDTKNEENIEADENDYTEVFTFTKEEDFPFYSTERSLNLVDKKNGEEEDLDDDKNGEQKNMVSQNIINYEDTTQQEDYYEYDEYDYNITTNDTDNLTVQSEDMLTSLDDIIGNEMQDLKNESPIEIVNQSFEETPTDDKNFFVQNHENDLFNVNMDMLDTLYREDVNQMDRRYDTYQNQEEENTFTDGFYDNHNTKEDNVFQKDLYKYESEDSNDYNMYTKENLDESFDISSYPYLKMGNKRIVGHKPETNVATPDITPYQYNGNYNDDYADTFYDEDNYYGKSSEDKNSYVYEDKFSYIEEILDESSLFDINLYRNMDDIFKKTQPKTSKPATNYENIRNHAIESKEIVRTNDIYYDYYKNYPDMSDDRSFDTDTKISPLEEKTSYFEKSTTPEENSSYFEQTTIPEENASYFDKTTAPMEMEFLNEEKDEEYDTYYREEYDPYQTNMDYQENREQPKDGQDIRVMFEGEDHYTGEDHQEKNYIPIYLQLPTEDCSRFCVSVHVTVNRMERHFKNTSSSSLSRSSSPKSGLSSLSSPSSSRASRQIGTSCRRTQICTNRNLRRRHRRKK